jgi:hypothetical protein
MGFVPRLKYLVKVIILFFLKVVIRWRKCFKHQIDHKHQYRSYENDNKRHYEPFNPVHLNFSQLSVEPAEQTADSEAAGKRAENNKKLSHFGNP